MADHANSAADLGEQTLATVRTVLHRAADLLDRIHIDAPLEVGEALELVFVALYELERDRPATGRPPAG
jgi:hypothetical protein